jgi:uncharacterized phage protein gp47/JayE
MGRARVPAAAATGVVTFEGAEGSIIGSGAEVGVLQTDPDLDPPTFVTTTSGIIDSSGEIDLPVVATIEGTIGNVAAGAIQLPLSGLPGVTSVSNAAATGGGAEVETDDALRRRLIKVFRGNIWGTKPWYENIVTEVPGVGSAFVIPHRDGAGTVAVILFDVDGEPVGTPVIDAVKALLDPGNGTGEGLSPLEHVVMVETGSVLNIYIAATIEPESGYSLTGTGATIALQTDIETAVAEYVHSLRPGEELVVNSVLTAIMNVEGVHDVTALTVDTVDPPVASDDIALDDDPAQVPRVAELTLT